MGEYASILGDKLFYRAYFLILTIIYTLSIIFIAIPNENVISLILRLSIILSMVGALLLSFNGKEPSKEAEYIILSNIMIASIFCFYSLQIHQYSETSILIFIIRLSVHSLALIAFIHEKWIGKFYLVIVPTMGLIHLSINPTYSTILIETVTIMITILTFVGHEFKLMSETQYVDRLRHYETIISNSPLIYFILDSEGKFLLSRGKGLDKIGSKQDQTVGMNAYELYGEYEEMLNAITTALEGEPAEHLSYVQDLDIYWNTKIIPVGKGNDLKLIGISVDVTELIKTHEKIQQNQLEMQQIQRLDTIGALSASIAHEFNNILTIYTSIGEVFALEADLTDSQKELVDEILETTDRGKNLVNQLLTFARKDYQKLENFDFNQFINQMSKLIEIAVKYKKITVEFNLSPDKIGIYADKNGIHQVILNLIINSIDAIPEEGNITISTKKDNENNCLILTIEDNGKGINENDLPRIFDPFFTTKSKGLGLGLSTTQSIIHNQNGTIEVKSQLGKGTKFIIKLPMSDEKLIRRKEEKSGVYHASVFEGTRIMILDDEGKILSLLEKILKRKGAETITALNGIEALNLINEDHEKIDLIITDLKMPKMGGKEFYDQYSQKYGVNTPVIFLTGFMDESSGLDTFVRTNPYTRLMTKPFVIEDLFVCIKELTDGLIMDD